MGGAGGSHNIIDTRLATKLFQVAPATQTLGAAEGEGACHSRYQVACPCGTTPCAALDASCQSSGPLFEPQQRCVRWELATLSCVHRAEGSAPEERGRLDAAPIPRLINLGERGS